MFTIINGIESQTKSVRYGVPQGSVLIPILFSLYIYDIKNISEKYEIKLFADDILHSRQFWGTRKSSKYSSKRLSYNWLSCNRLTLNTTKTHYLLLRNYNKQLPKLNLYIGDHIIKEKMRLNI